MAFFTDPLLLCFFDTQWKPFLDGIQSSVISVKLYTCLEEAWPVILQALLLDAVPANSTVDESSPTVRSKNIPASGYSMVELRLDDFEFLWGFLLLVLFQEQDVALSEHIISVSSITSKSSSDFSVDDSNSSSLKLYTIFFSVLQEMSTKRFFTSGFLSLDACRELLQVCMLLLYLPNVSEGIFFLGSAQCEKANGGALFAYMHMMFHL